MSQTKLTIGALAERAHTTVPTIRYYETIGLLPRAQRATNGHRHYRETDLQRLRFIRRCRDFGFPIDQVRALVELVDDGDRACNQVRDLARSHLDTVRAKLQEMRQLEASLAAYVASCDQACCTGPTKACVIIEDLSAIRPAAFDCCRSQETAPAAM